MEEMLVPGGQESANGRDSGATQQRVEDSDVVT